MIHIIILTAEENLHQIQNELYEVENTLGGTQWRTIAGVILPKEKNLQEV